MDALSFGFGAVTAAARSKISELIAAYCALLAGEDDTGGDLAEGVFFERDSRGGRGSGPAYMVMIEKACARLKNQVLETIVEERWGREARRVFRIIEGGNKLSENLVSMVATR